MDLRFCARICTLPLGLLAYATLCAPPRPCSCDNFALQMKNANTGISENFTSCLVSNPPLIRAFVALINYDSTSSAMFQLLHFLFHFALQPYSQYSVGPTSYASTSPKLSAPLVETPGTKTGSNIDSWWSTVLTLSPQTLAIETENCLTCHKPFQQPRTPSSLPTTCQLKSSAPSTWLFATNSLVINAMRPGLNTTRLLYSMLA